MKQLYQIGLQQLKYSTTATNHASERVFSLFNNSFGFKQNSSLEDYVETSIILQYNDINVYF